MFGSIVSRLGDAVSQWVVERTLFGPKQDTHEVHDFFVKVGDRVSDVYYSALAEITFFFLKRDAQIKFDRLFSRKPSDTNKPSTITCLAPSHNPQTGQSIGGLVPPSSVAPAYGSGMGQPLATAAPAIGARLFTDATFRMPMCQMAMPSVIPPHCPL